MTRSWAWPTMGSMASLSIPVGRSRSGAAALDTERVEPAVQAVREWLVRVEDALSPYRESSDLCRWRSGSVALADCSPLLGEILDVCESLQRFTEGGFHPYDQGGRFDPTGYVKGWAVERAVEILAGAGVPDACLGVGGDLQMIGHAAPDRPWRVAVVDPRDRTRPVVVVADPGFGRLAVATSGDAERGDHIWHLPGGRPSDAGPSDAGPAARRARGRLRSITVVGPDLRLADSFATAIWAHERTRPLAESWAWLAGTGYEALGVDAAGRFHTTPGMVAYVVRPGTSATVGRTLLAV